MRKVAVGLCVAVILLTTVGGLGATDARATAPRLLSERAAALADSISGEWAHSVNQSGDIVDPITGAPEGGYGRTMLAYGMLRASQRNPQLNLLPIIRRALPRSDDVAQAPFNLLGIAETLARAGGALGPSVTEELAGTILSYPPFGTHAAKDPCFRKARCYHNLKLVSATAVLATLAALPARTGPALTTFATRAAAARSARRLLTTTIPRVQIPDAQLNVGQSRLRGATLSDPKNDPTAYLALSAMMLGRSLELYARPPAAALLSFRRAVVALLGLTAPDGAISYMGRGQAQVWTFASAAASCALAMRLLPNQPLVASRCEGLIETELGALDVRRSLGGIGIATVQRLGWTHGEGVDHYANPTDYNGLSVYALNMTADALENLSDPGELATPGAVSGEQFIDSRGSGVATTSLNGLWFAIHREDSNRADSRWGFGLLAMERFTGSGWTSTMTPRPLGPGMQGPVLILHGHHYRPVGMSIHGAPGRVTLSGGWSAAGRLVRKATFTYEGTPQGVVLRVPVHKGDRLRLGDWALPGQTGTLSISGWAGGHVAAKSGVTAGNAQSPRLQALTYTLDFRRSGLARVLWRG